MIRYLGIALVICLSGCGGVTNPGSPPNDFSSGNFLLNIVASDSCTTLADPGRNRSWNMGLVMTGTIVSVTMQGWPDETTVIAQTNMAGTANGSSLILVGSIFDTVVACAEPLCYRGEGTITATQSGNVIRGTLNGVVAYEQTSCTAADHKVTFTRR
jgi:hypothetical protein